MSEPKKSIPKPNLNKSTPAAPPVTTFDDTPPSAPKPEETSSPEPKKPDSSATKTGAIETDLMTRFVGAFVDGIIAGLIGFVTIAITGSTALQLVAIAIVFLTRDSLPFLNGQSIGKKVTNTKAVKEDGSSLSGDWVTGATRNILLAIPLAGLVECFIIITRKEKPEAGIRLGDEWAKTKVISLE